MTETQLFTERPLPSDVNVTALEEHLTDQDFDRVFKMTREQFRALPKWRAIALKKDKKLF